MPIASLTPSGGNAPTSAQLSLDYADYFPSEILTSANIRIFIRENGGIGRDIYTGSLPGSGRVRIISGFPVPAFTAQNQAPHVFGLFLTGFDQNGNALPQNTDTNFTYTGPPPETLTLNSITPDSGALPSSVLFVSAIQNYVPNFPIRRYFLQYFDPATGQFEDLQSSVVNSANLSDSANIPAVPGGSVRLRTRVSGPDIVSNELVYTVVAPPPPPVLTPCQPGQNAGEWAKSPADLGFSPSLPDGDVYGGPTMPIASIFGYQKITPDRIFIRQNGVGTGNTFIYIGESENPSGRRIRQIILTGQSTGPTLNLVVRMQEVFSQTPTGIQIGGSRSFGATATQATIDGMGLYANLALSVNGGVWNLLIQVDFF